MTCVFPGHEPPWTCSQCGRVHARQNGTPILSAKPPHRNCDKEKKRATVKIQEGPGTELKRLIGLTGIKVEADCNCNKHAKLMDQRGPDWCEKNLELIVDWLEEEAEKIGLPFVRLAGKLIVKRAIRNSRKQQKKTGQH